MNTGDPGTPVRAALVRTRDSLAIEACELDAPGPGEVRLRILACGICHTDLLAMAGEVGTPFPAILGHEGVGVIEAMSEGCVGFAVGDRVIASFAACRECGSCRQGAPAYCKAAYPLNFLGQRPSGDGPVRRRGSPVTSQFFGQSAFASHAVVSMRNLVALPPDIPAELAAPMACGVQTGASSVLDVLDVREDDSLAVFGCGSVGMAAIMAAALRGCRRIVAVDLREDRLALARELGATETVLAATDDQPFSAVAPVHKALDCVGHARVTAAAFRMLRRQGRLLCVGVGPAGDGLDIDPRELVFGGASIQGSIEGDADPREFIPRMIAHWRAGELPLEKIVRTYPFEHIAQAIDDLRTGAVIKPVLLMEQADGAS